MWLGLERSHRELEMRFGLAELLPGQRAGGDGLRVGTDDQRLEHAAGGRFRVGREQC